PTAKAADIRDPAIAPAGPVELVAVGIDAAIGSIAADDDFHDGAVRQRAGILRGDVDVERRVFFRDALPHLVDVRQLGIGERTRVAVDVVGGRGAGDESAPVVVHLAGEIQIQLGGGAGKAV